MKDCQGQLLDRVRRGLATAQEQTAFDVHLDSCESCQMTLEVMDDFDAVGKAESGDWERVAAMASAAAAAHGRSAPTGFGRARRRWQLAVAALAVTGAAAAAVAVGLATDSRDETAAPQSPQAGAVDGATKTSVDSGKASDSEVAVPAVESPKAPAEKVEPPAARRNSPARDTTLSTTAKDAYRVANDARRAGRASEAILGYQTLQRKFASSPEAHASRVSLGGLLLRAGSASAALAQFDAYLAAGGQLAAEAVFGKAQALRALGRSTEEVQTLNRLVTTYPQSAYATHAQRRLLELR